MDGASFEWDPLKDRANQEKHGLTFLDAQRAFFDPLRVIAEDLTHGEGERRYFCFGRVGGGIATVRFTLASWMHSDIRCRLLAERESNL